MATKKMLTTEEKAAPVNTNPTTMSSTQPDLSMNNPAYKALIDKGYSAEQISNAWAGIQAKQTKPVNTPVATTPTATSTQPKVYNEATGRYEAPTDTLKPQVVPPTEVKLEQQKTPAEVTTTSKEILGNWDYQDTSEQRQQQILANLESAYAANPNAFFNENEFKKVYNVGTGLRAKQQDETMMNWYQGKMDAIKKQDQLTKQLAQFKTMTKTELATITPEQSAIIFNSGDEQLLNQWMLAKKEKQQLDLLNGTISYEDILGGKDLYETSLSDEYKKDVTDQLSPLATELSDIEINYKNLQDSYNNILRDVTKEFEGTGATMSKINAVAAKRQREMLPQLQQAQNEYNGKANLYNAQKQLLLEEFNMNIQQQQMDMQKLGFSFSLYQYANAPQRELEMMKAKYDFENPDINSSDSFTAKRALNNSLTQYYKDFGAIIQRPQGKVVEDVMKYARDNGVSISQALQENFIKPLQGKAEYKSLIRKQYGLESSQSLTNIGDKPYIVTTNADGSLSFKPFIGDNGVQVTDNAYTGMKGAGARNNNPGNIKDTSFGNVIGRDSKGFAIFATPEEGFDALVEKVKYNQTNSKSKYFGKTIAEYFKMYAPASDGNDPVKYAQSVANNLGVSVNTKISQLDTTQFAAQIAKHDSGYDYSSYGKGQTSTIGTGYDDNLSWVFEAMSQNKGKLDSTTQKSLKDLGINIMDIGSQYNAWKNKKSEEIKPHTQALLDNIDNLINISKGQYDSMLLNIPRTEGRALRAELNQMVSSMALQKLIELKSQGATFGALSNQELLFIDEAAGGKKFSTTLRFEDRQKNMKEFQRILTKLNNTVGSSGYVDIYQQPDMGVGSMQGIFDYGTLFSQTQ